MKNSLAQAPEDGWELDDFLTTVEEEMARLEIPAAAPDRRTVRYYATIGLLDRPELVGRQARYRQHHLAQVLALKRLQAEGLRLAAISSRLEGQDTRSLIMVACSTDRRHSPGPLPVWAENLPRQDAPRTRTVTELVLAPGISLLIEADGLTPTQSLAITNAAGPLLQRISSLGLDPR